MLTCFAVVGFSGAVWAQEIGIKECDEFLTHYQQCAEKSLPSEVQTMMLQTVRDMRGQYRDLKQQMTPQQMVEMCTTARASMKQTLVEALKCTP